jgi:hypothetical protein
MKHLLAAVVLAGCATMQSPEPQTVKAPDISIHGAAGDGNIEAVLQRSTTQPGRGYRRKKELCRPACRRGEAPEGIHERVRKGPQKELASHRKTQEPKNPRTLVPRPGAEGEDAYTPTLWVGEKSSLPAGHSF